MQIFSLLLRIYFHSYFTCLLSNCKKSNMWPLIMAVLRRNAVFITLPAAAVIGFIGYNLENLISDKYTPFSSKYNSADSMFRKSSSPSSFLESIQENRAERLTANLEHPEMVEKLQLKENVLERNLSPSLKARDKM